MTGAKRTGPDFLEVAAPEIADVDSGRKNFEPTAKYMGRQTMGKQLAGGSRKKTTNRVIPAKFERQTSQTPRENFTNISY